MGPGYEREDVKEIDYNYGKLKLDKYLEYVILLLNSIIVVITLNTSKPSLLKRIRKS